MKCGEYSTRLPDVSDVDNRRDENAMVRGTMTERSPEPNASFAPNLSNPVDFSNIAKGNGHRPARDAIGRRVVLARLSRHRHHRFEKSEHERLT